MFIKTCELLKFGTIEHWNLLSSRLWFLCSCQWKMWNHRDNRHSLPSAIKRRFLASQKIQFSYEARPDMKPWVWTNDSLVELKFNLMLIIGPGNAFVTMTKDQSFAQSYTLWQFRVLIKVSLPWTLHKRLNNYSCGYSFPQYFSEYFYTIRFLPLESTVKIFSTGNSSSKSIRIYCRFDPKADIVKLNVLQHAKREIIARLRVEFIFVLQLSRINFFWFA